MRTFSCCLFAASRSLSCCRASRAAPSSCAFFWRLSSVRAAAARALSDELDLGRPAFFAGAESAEGVGVAGDVLEVGVGVEEDKEGVGERARRMRDRRGKDEGKRAEVERNAEGWIEERGREVRRRHREVKATRFRTGENIGKEGRGGRRDRGGAEAVNQRRRALLRPASVSWSAINSTGREGVAALDDWMSQIWGGRTRDMSESNSGGGDVSDVMRGWRRCGVER